MKKIKLLLISIVSISLLNSKLINIKAIDTENEIDIKETNSNSLGIMNIEVIDPISNPAEDNWLSREVAKQTLGNEELYSQLTQDNFNSVTRITISNQIISVIPSQIGNLINLKHLSLSGTGINELPEAIGNLESLQSLILSNNNISSFPNSVTNMKNLKLFDLNNNKLAGSIPIWMMNLVHLQELTLFNNQKTEIPIEISNLINLKSLNLYNNNLEVIPSEIGNLTSLNNLNLSNNLISEIPEDITNLNKLRVLTMFGNNITNLPNNFSSLSNLKIINLSSNKLGSVPTDLFNMNWITGLNLSYNNISEIPKEISKLNSLETLNLSRNNISIIPNEINDLKNLTGLNLLNQNIILPEILIKISDKKWSIDNPIYLFNEPVKPIESDIIFDSNLNKIIFDNIDNTTFTFNTISSVNDTRFTYSGNVYQPINIIQEDLNNIPTINADDIAITEGTTFDPLLDVTSSDKEDGDITKNIKVINNNVDTNKPGIYEVTYEVTDSDGASTTKTITVTVVNEEKPITPPTGDSSNLFAYFITLISTAIALVSLKFNKQK